MRAFENGGWTRTVDVVSEEQTNEKALDQAGLDVKLPVWMSINVWKLKMDKWGYDDPSKEKMLDDKKFQIFIKYS